MICILIESNVKAMIAGFLKSRPKPNFHLRIDDLALVADLLVFIDKNRGLVYY